MKELIGLFDQFKASHEDRYKALQNQIDEFQAKSNRMGNRAYSAEGSEVSTVAEMEHAKGFQAFARKGIDNGLRAMEIQAAMTDGSDPDGGYAIPVELDRNVDKILRNAVAMRRLANVITGTVGYHKLVSANNTASGWVGETDARPNTGTPQLIKLTPYFGEIYANPSCSQNSLDDIFFDVESFLQESISEEFIWQEGAAFITGDGIKKPKGILSFPTAATADGVRPFGTIQYVVSGDANGFPATTATFCPYDLLIDLTGAVKAAYRQNASFLMNKKTLTFLRKVKTTLEGEYIVAPATATAPPTIDGYPIEEDENMPDIAAGSFPIAFGDFKKAYTIVDILGTRVLRDNLTLKPMVQFYTTKRTGAFLNSSEAIKFLKISV